MDSDTSFHPALKESFPKHIWLDVFGARLMQLRPSLGDSAAAECAAQAWDDLFHLDPGNAAELFSAGDCMQQRHLMKPMRITRTTRDVAGELRTDSVQVAGASTQVDTTSAQGSSAPALPSERDEKVGMTGGAQSGRVQQGARDLKRGLQDTSRAPEADAAYEKQKR